MVQHLHLIVAAELVKLTTPDMGRSGREQDL